jgi:putative CocE/NonD family hydrolase
VNVTSQLLQRLFKLPPPTTRDVAVARDLRVLMPDGVELLANRWAPKHGADGLPTALYRSPYGRRGMMGLTQGRAMAERGFQVLIVSARGTFGSGGTFDPMRQERADGLATLDWVVKQPWFGDSIVLLGGSYLGYVQWAVADQLPPEVKAMIPQVTESALSLEFLRKGGMSLETPFAWGIMTDGQERRGAILRQLFSGRKHARALFTIPLRDADVAATGHRIGYVQDILTHDAESPRWSGIDHSMRVADVTVPVSSIGGWYDIFLPGQLRDFRILQDAGRPARLTVGPWAHMSVDPVIPRESIEFGLAHARREQPPHRAPVRLYVMGEEAWRDFDTWPPKDYAPQRFYLQSDGSLSTELPGESEPDNYRYYPSDPTPAVGGVLMRIRGAGRVDNRVLEARPDVLCFTSDVLDRDVEIIGDVSAEVWFRSSLRYADVFVRLCDVDTQGRSYNVCDGLVNLSGANEIACATVQLWPTAYRFKRGHRIRVQVSSGAFPRYARNPGTGDPLATATRLMTADQQVYHDPAHPSAVIMPTR